MTEKQGEPTNRPHMPVPCRGWDRSRNEKLGWEGCKNQSTNEAAETKVQMTSVAGALAVWAGAGWLLAAVNPATPPGSFNSLDLLCKGRDASLPPFFPTNLGVQGSLNNPNQNHGKG